MFQSFISSLESHVIKYDENTNIITTCDSEREYVYNLDTNLVTVDTTEFALNPTDLAYKSGASYAMRTVDSVPLHEFERWLSFEYLGYTQNPHVVTNTMWGTAYRHHLVYKHIDLIGTSFTILNDEVIFMNNPPICLRSRFPRWNLYYHNFLQNKP